MQDSKGPQSVPTVAMASLEGSRESMAGGPTPPLKVMLRSCNYLLPPARALPSPGARRPPARARGLLLAAGIWGSRCPLPCEGPGPGRSTDSSAAAWPPPGRRPASPGTVGSGEESLLLPPHPMTQVNGSLPQCPEPTPSATSSSLSE